MHNLNILEKVGNTPMISIRPDGFEHLSLFVKMEAFNPTGSVKDRAAYYILRKLMENNTINKDTAIIESTSGNFGVALSSYCRFYGFRFIAVVDPNITPMNEMLIRSAGAEMIKVTQPDKYGGYLLTRIEKVNELRSQIENSYWVNQYENPLNAAAYYHTLGKEICFQADEIDYIFMGVSSGGTITGVSQKIRENFPQAKIIAVDVEGSLIFKNQARKRYIPGIGSSMVPKILESARIDEVVWVDELETIDACYELLEKHSIFSGGSSGSVFAAIKKYFSKMDLYSPAHVVAVFPDRGERYYDTVYSETWCRKIRTIRENERTTTERILK